MEKKVLWDYPSRLVPLSGQDVSLRDKQAGAAPERSPGPGQCMGSAK